MEIFFKKLTGDGLVKLKHRTPEGKGGWYSGAGSSEVCIVYRLGAGLQKGCENSRGTESLFLNDQFWKTFHDDLTCNCLS